MNPFGPLLRFELVRIARRQRLTLARCLYALTTAAIAAAVYAAASRGFRSQPRPQDLARITEGLFFGLFVLQFLAAIGLVQRFTTATIAGEKERQTLPFLLATPLRDSEIVIGKLIAQLAQVAVILLAGLPILCALQFFGGVEPLLGMLGFAALAATLLSMGAVGLLCSVYARTTRMAGRRAGQIVALYVVGVVILDKVLRAVPAIAAFPGTVIAPAAVSVQDAVDALGVGNPLAAGQQLVEAVRGGGRFADAVWPTVRDYVAFHLVAAAGCLTWAVVRLRPVAAAHAEGSPPPARTGLRRAPPRPSVDDRPVVWKTLHFDARQYHTTAGRAFAQVVFGLSFLPVVLTLVISGALGAWQTLPETMNGFVRGLGTLTLCGVLPMIAGQASGSIAIERRKRTLDDLLMTDLSTDEILAQKWWVSILLVRWALVWVGIHWLLGIATGGLHPLAVPLLALEWAAYAAFAASLGMYWAARARTARGAGSATGWLGFAAAMLPIFVTALIGLATRSGNPFLLLVPAAPSPPAALGMSAFSWKDLAFVRGHPREIVLLVAGAATGVVVYAGLAWRLWRGACWWFPRTVGRL